MAQAAAFLQQSHARVLGVLQADRDALQQRYDGEQQTLRATARRNAAIAATKATNTITAAHIAAREAAADLRAASRAGALAAAEHIELGLIGPDREDASVNADLDVPLVVPLLGYGHVTVVGDTAVTDAFARNIQAEALLGTTPGDLALWSFDPRLGNPLAPFVGLNNVDQGLVRNTQTPRDLDALIDELTTTVARIGDVLQGVPGDLIEHRARLGMSVERFHLVTLHDYPHSVAEAQHERLMLLADVAPRHGISFVFQVAPDLELPDWLDLERLRGLGESFDLEDTSAGGGAGDLVWRRRPDLKLLIPQISPDQARQVAGEVAVAAEKISLPVVPFADIQPDAGWATSSAEGITFAVGKAGPKPVEITFGDDREQKHNALITGAVGQGKSNLLKVIIYSIAARYAADEVELFLLDFKEGVTLYPMAPTPGSPEFLPHARVLGIEADQDFGLAVLSHLESEFVRRARLFKPFGDSISRYRAANPEARMPRIVLIVDEFHLLLDDGGDKVGAQAAKLLEQVVRRGRSYGVHVILASQSISGISTLLGSSQGVFSQFPIRLGLKNSPQEAVATFSQGNDAAARLRFRGEAVLNKEYGAFEANQSLMVAAADDDQLARLRDELHARASRADGSDGTGVIAPPNVFDGSAAGSLLEDIPALRALRKETAAGRAPRIPLGRPLTVDQSPVAFTLEASPGRALAIIGAGTTGDDFDAAAENAAMGVLQAAGLALALQHAPGTAEFVILDALVGRDRELGDLPGWVETLTGLGHQPVVVPQREIIGWLSAAAKELPQRSAEAPPLYLLGFNIDRVGPLDIKEGVAPAPEKAIQGFFRSAPVAGVHPLLWWSNPATFLAHLGLLRNAPFDGTLLLQGTEDIAQRIHGPLTQWTPTAHRALFEDAATSAGLRKMIPYAPLDADARDRLVAEVSRD
ncbi:FtsK/SpoIIIE domain-containing protein [Nocardioides albertanoniae]|uniref:FtsK/SpoIIIE domain-containing protein n=1 Tax=Nocardioides albertanoniae TaxID=1175486 RepID=UPI00114E2010|nr:FtsK/SpoIIIE domain-containing protein [Nocardioides albertanoniae]